MHITGWSCQRCLLISHRQVAAGPWGASDGAHQEGGLEAGFAQDAFMPSLRLQRGKPPLCWTQTGCDNATDTSVTAHLEEIICKRCKDPNPHSLEN